MPAGPTGSSSTAAARPRRRRVVRRLPSWAALLGAVVGYWLSFTPSLLPRPWLLQAVAAAVTALIGYVVGAVVGRILQIWLEPPPRVRRIAWGVLLAGGLAAVVWVTAWSVRWQGDARRAVAMDPRVVWWQWALVPVVAVVLFALLLLIGRAIRLGTRALGRLLGRVMPTPMAVGAAVALVVVVIVGVVQGFLLRGLLDMAEGSAELANDTIQPDVPQPTLPTLSGGPQSLEAWSTLGFNGREFVAKTPTRAQISAFTGRPATDPVRVYVGLRSAPTLEQRARLAVAELERTGAFHRKVLTIMSTTGSGWINENVATPLEYMYGGDSAMVAIQYSYLPSWISFLTESEATDAGRALYTAVYDHWRSLPADHRPKLLLAGESLGSYATEQAFEGSLARIASSGATGVLLVGPTPDNPIRHQVTDHRDAGTPQWLPVYQNGHTVRFARRGPDLDRPPGAPWPSPRVVYLQNGSDPVTWWETSLILHRPQWLRPPRAPDLSPDMQWYPLVTFWQVVCDLAGANNVPDGYGHRFGTLPVQAWSRIAPPPGWTAADADRLSHLLASQREDDKEP